MSFCPCDKTAKKYPVRKRVQDNLLGLLIQVTLSKRIVAYDLFNFVVDAGSSAGLWLGTFLYLDVIFATCRNSFCTTVFFMWLKHTFVVGFNLDIFPLKKYPALRTPFYDSFASYEKSPLENILDPPLFVSNNFRYVHTQHGRCHHSGNLDNAQKL